MTLAEAAQKLGVSAKAVRRWRRDGVAVRGGRAYLACVTPANGIADVSPEELSRFLASIGRSASPAPSAASRRKRSKAADRELKAMGV